MDDFERELKVGFLEEASQLLTDAEQCFLVLESNPSDSPTIEKIFRIAHNIKGSSKAVGFDALGAFTHEFESFLLKCKNGQMAIVPETISLLLKCNDHVKAWVEALKADLEANLDNATLIGELHAFVAPDAQTEVSPSTPPESNEDTFSAADVAVMENVLNQLVDESIETAEPVVATPAPSVDPFEAMQAMVAASLAAEATPIVPAAAESAPVKAETSVEPAKVIELKPPTTPAKPATPATGGQSGAADESIRVSLARLEKLINFVGELVILQTVLKEQAYGSNPVILRRTIQQMGKVTKEVQDISMGLRMVPLKQTFQKMQRIVRDTSGILGKKVSLQLEGDETEVDKTVLEALGDPLVHLIRNAVDHGIETPADRVAKGKPETGTVKLFAYHQGSKLVIEVKDDGGGIPAERLKQKAIEKGILKPGQTISEKEAVHLIFHPGFSTKAQVTEVSGRGVGMDVVKTNIEQLQGEIIVDTVLGQGSTFKIILPLTLAIIDGMVIRCGDEKFVIPLAHVHESVKLDAKDIKFATGMGEVLFLRGENLPIFRLGSFLAKKRVGKVDTDQIAVIIRSQGRPFAAFVDDVIGQQQVVIKKLGAEVQHIKGYSGSAILGDGKPALILELSELVLAQSSGIMKRQVAS